MKLFLTGLLSVAIASFASNAYSQTIWTNTGSTSFESPANWNNGVPTAGVDAYVVPNGIGEPNGEFLVTPGGPANITIVAAASHSSDGFFVVNDIGSTLAVGSVNLTFAPSTAYSVNLVGVDDSEALTYTGNLNVATEVFVGAAGNGSMTYTTGTLNGATASFDIGDGNIGSFSQVGNSNVTVSDIELGMTGGTGTYIIAGTGNNLTVNGSLEIGVGTFVQNDSSSVVDFTGAFTEMGLSAGDNASYLLQAGTLNLGDMNIGVSNNTTSVLTQSGGTLNSDGFFTVGSSSGAKGTYNLQGGTATFNNGIEVTANGSIYQTGGTLIIPTGESLDISALGATYTLGGGILEIGDGDMVGTTGQAGLIFSGGTLEITNGAAYSLGLDVKLANGTSTIDAETTAGIDSVTLSGQLTGAGGIALMGNGNTVFNLSNTNNTYTGITSVDGGTLGLSPNQAGVISSSFLNIGPTGTLNLNLNAGGLAYAGGIGGSGALNINFANAGDAFVILNSSSLTGPITLGANGVTGKLQIYSGTYGNIGDNGTNSGVQIGGAPLSGNASVPASGVVTLGNNTYTGTTTVSQNFTLYADSLNGDLVNNGALGLVPSDAIGSTLTINGALTSNAGSVLTFRAIGNVATPVADLIHVTGAGTLDHDTTLSIVGTGSITVPIPILTADGGLTLTGGFPIVNGTLLFSPTVTQVGNSLELTAVQSPVSPFATTPNQAAVAVPIDQAIANPGSMNSSQLAAFNKVLTGFNTFTSASQVSSALEQLTPESLQYARMISFENSNMMAIRMNGFDASIRAGYDGLDTNAVSIVTPGMSSGLGRSLGSMMAYNDPAFHQAAPNGVNYYPGDSAGGSTMSDGSSPSASSSSSSARGSDSTSMWNSSSQVISDSPNPYLAHQHPSGPEAPSFSEFIGGDVVLADLNQNTGSNNAPSSKASYTAGDATAGVAFRMNSHLAAGVLFDYNHTDAKTDSSGSKTKVDSYSPGLFATYYDHGFYANGLFSFGYNTYSNTRDIGFLGETAKSNPDGQQYVGDLDLGYDFHPDKQWIVGPTLGVTYTHLDIDSFTETGATGANLAVQDQSADSLRSRLGGHVTFQTFTGDVLLQPNLSVMWQHESLDDSSGITSSFNDFSSSSFTIETAAPSRDSALISCGLTATLSNSMALYIAYVADVGADDYFAQSVIGGFKTRF